MFQLVEVSDLKMNTKYKIMASYEYRGLYEGPIQLDSVYLQFGNIFNVTKNEFCGHSYFYTSRKIYAFVSQQPQWNMERRAVNLILRRLIGDDCFEW
jgi:hypothetical protein